MIWFRGKRGDPASFLIQVRFGQAAGLLGGNWQGIRVTPSTAGFARSVFPFLFYWDFRNVGGSDGSFICIYLIV